MKLGGKRVRKNGKRKCVDVKLHVVLHVEKGKIIGDMRETATWHREISSKVIVRGWYVIVRSSLFKPPLLHSSLFTPSQLTWLCF